MTRELRDFRTQRYDVPKEPGPRIHGRIVRLFPERGYGFIETEAQREVYFHAHAVHGIDCADLRPGMVVDLDIEAGEQGPQASRLTPHR
jgi:cold shock CspA family protein